MESYWKELYLLTGLFGIHISTLSGYKNKHRFYWWNFMFHICATLFLFYQTSMELWGLTKVLHKESFLSISNRVSISFFCLICYIAIINQKIPFLSMLDHISRIPVHWNLFVRIFLDLVVVAHLASGFLLCAYISQWDMTCVVHAVKTFLLPGVIDWYLVSFMIFFTKAETYVEKEVLNCLISKSKSNFINQKQLQELERTTWTILSAHNTFNKVRKLDCT